MKETLRQAVSRLASENQSLREQNSVLSTDNKFLREKLAEADIRARKLISRVNHPERNAEVSARRAAMLAAKEAAMKSGKTVSVAAMQAERDSLAAHDIGG